MIRAVIFDCFGVLAEDAWLPFKRQFIGDNLELAEQVGDLGKQNEYGIIRNDDYFRQTAELIGVEQNHLRDILSRRVPNEALFDFIHKELKPHYKIGLLSNANFDVTKDLFTPDQAAVFDATVMSFECKLIKPDERMFDLTATRLGVARNECLFVDDIERYCVAAESYGMQTILYTSPEQLISAVSQVLSV